MSKDEYIYKCKMCEGKVKYGGFMQMVCLKCGAKNSAKLVRLTDDGRKIK